MQTPVETHTYTKKVRRLELEEDQIAGILERWAEKNHGFGTGRCAEPNYSGSWVITETIEEYTSTGDVEVEGN